MDSKLTKNQKKRNRKKQAAKSASVPNADEENKDEAQTIDNAPNDSPTQVPESEESKTESALPFLPNPYKTQTEDEKVQAFELVETNQEDESQILEEVKVEDYGDSHEIPVATSALDRDQETNQTNAQNEMP